MNEDGQIRQRSENRNFNKHNNDTTQRKEIPRGIYVWTVDRKFGDIRPATVDTLPHLFQNTIFNTGIYGEYNTTGNNYTARENRIVIDRPLAEQFIFTQPYSFVIKSPDALHFTNTLSPITNISYDNCGNKTNGEDHINAKFAVNAGKRLGFGFDLNYLYARGYYDNQSTSHFGATFYASYLGDKYKMHSVFSTYHQKVAENGGITDDNYITHPESFDDSYSENEIPTVLHRNWNRNDNMHLFLTHRYSVGFYRRVKMSDEEIKARQFAMESKKENEARKAAMEDGERNSRIADKRGNAAGTDFGRPAGRPENARIAGDEPEPGGQQVDTTRIKVESAEAMDSMLMAKAVQDSIYATMKDEFVPVTSFIHTLDVNKYNRIYQAYESPENYYADTYYNSIADRVYSGDSIYDQTRHLSVRNIFGIALLEGFNKWAKSGLKVFASHELRKFDMPDYISDKRDVTALHGWTENSVSIGGQLQKTGGETFHYNAMAETWIAGEDAGQLKADFSADVNFRFLGDTVTLAAKAYFYRLNPTFYQRNYHSKHIWWDNGGMSKETRTRIEGLFSYRKTRTSLRVAVEEIQNYTYFGMSYNATSEGRTEMSAGVHQCSSNINLLTAQLRQDFRLGPLNWENVVTYQNTSRQDVLPVPDLNVFSNLYLKFKIVKELSVELGGSVTFFTKYDAPDFCPQLNQFAVQQNPDSRVSLGGYPFVDVYANMHLKRTRFFIMYSHVNGGSGNRMYFLVPHYPQNGSVMRFGLSWNFFN